MVYIHTAFFICPSVSAKTAPASSFGNRGGSLCFIRAFSSPHAITCGGS